MCIFEKTQRFSTLNCQTQILTGAIDCVIISHAPINYIDIRAACHAHLIKRPTTGCKQRLWQRQRLSRAD